RAAHRRARRGRASARGGGARSGLYLDSIDFANADWYCHRQMRTCVVLACLLLAACPKPQNEIVVGEYGSLTGSEATFGQSTHNGVSMAVEEINAAGGIRGKKVRLVNYDDQGKTSEVGTAVTRLITQDRAIAFIGEVASSL